MASKHACMWCGRKKSLTTLRRHHKYGCSRTAQRQTRLRLAVDASLARLHRILNEAPRRSPTCPPTPRVLRPSRHYHRRDPPLGQPPFPLRISRRQSSLLHNSANDPFVDPHLDAQFDTPGSGPGPSSRQHSPRFSPAPTTSDPQRQLTLGDINPEFAGMSFTDYLTQTARSGMAHNPGKLITLVSNTFAHKH